MTTSKTIPFDLKHVHHVLSEQAVVELATKLQTHVGPVVLDLETTGLDEYRWTARVVTLSITLPYLDEEGEEYRYPDTYVVGLSHPDCALHTEWRKHLKTLTRAIFVSGQGIIGQNIRFDVRWLTQHTGIDLSGRIEADTGLGFHLLDENQTASLKPRCMKEFGIDSWIDFDWGQIEREQKKDKNYPHCALLAERVDYYTMALYNARDTYWTWRAHQMQSERLGLIPSARENLLMDGTREDIEALRLGDYYTKVSVPAVRTLTSLEQNGMKLDRRWCENRLVELEEECEKEANELLDLLGFCQTWNGLTDEQEAALRDNQMSFQATSLWFKAWAEVMCENDKLRVVALTEKGAPSWAKSVLKRLARAGYPAAEHLLAWKRADKEASYLRSWLELAGDDDRLHATYNYYKVVTGRLSAENPNTQQIPRGAKNAFIASPGYVLVAADYSQIELRVAAHIAQCKPMIEAFNEGHDLHTLMAAMINDCDPNEVTKDQRQQAKAANFGFLFGMGWEKFIDYAADSYDVDFTPEEAQKFRKGFFDTWEGMAAWHNRQRGLAKEYGRVKSPLGRIRHLPDVDSRVEEYRSRAERQAINSPVQGMASDMMLIAAAKIRKNFPLIRPVALVHDCIVCEVPEAQAKEMALAIKNTMENVAGDLERLGCKFSVPLVADVEIGKSWGSTEKLS